MKIRHGDLIQIAHEYDVVVHGCNCFCTFMAGFARQVAAAWPEAEYVDKMTVRGKISKLGTITTAWNERDGIIVVNAYTQFNYGRNGVLVNYEAVRKCFWQVAAVFRDKRIAYPRIGAGLGGGDWDTISKIIDRELDGMDHTLVLLQE